MERIVTAQLKFYFQENGLFSPAQSAYRHHHSTETALLYVTNEVLLSLDRGDEVVLILLDFSSAFDLISHSILFERLQNRYGITGTVLKWCISYLNNRKQAVVINDAVSDWFPMPWGVPQGSVKGPLDFILYTAPLSDIIDSHGIQHVIYADDTQIFLTINSSNRTNAVKSLEACVADIHCWATENKLLLNDSKTEVLHFHSKFRSFSVLPTVKAGRSDIFPCKSTKDLGVILDDSLQLKEHIRNVCRKASYGLYKISRIRKYLDKSSTEHLVHAFISSHLDCNNSLLFGLPKSHLHPLQRIQNSAARLITRSKPFNHISPILNELHWLPVVDRITFKICLLTFKAIHGFAPSYICNLVSLSCNPSLRSSNCLTLRPGPFAKTHFYGDRSFAVAAPKLWNSLSVNIRCANSLQQFKSLLKTHLFK